MGIVFLKTHMKKVLCVYGIQRIAEMLFPHFFLIPEVEPYEPFSGEYLSNHGNILLVG